ncbi:MAG TPA: multicopper oxidase domain-containing protein [Gemmatimonadaceae bacterium]|nr:multicopper oxidase domain-containing protein [Gemmatimonadaceae bacterium]
MKLQFAALAMAVSTTWAAAWWQNEARTVSAGEQSDGAGTFTRALPNDNRVGAGHLVNGVFTLELEARAVDWFPGDTGGPAIPVYAFAEEGQPATVPGPMIRVPVGTELRVTVRNALGKPLRVLGLQERASAKLDSIVVAPGATHEFQFRADLPGTYYYFGRTERAFQSFPGRSRDGSLIGAFIVDAPETKRHDERILLITMWEDTAAALGIKSEYAHQVLRRESVPRNSWLFMAVNGRSWPHTERLSYSVGDTVRWRVINGAAFPHPMHLHGFHFTVLGRGHALLDTVYAPGQRRLAVTEWMIAGTTVTMTWVPERPGNWLFHCHLVTHISDANRVPARLADHPDAGHGKHAESGMAGLVIGIHVKPVARTAPARDPAPRRRLRLFVTERANVFNDRPAYSYVLQQGLTPPAADSIQPVGSTLVLRQNEPTQITIMNATTHATSIHWHGIELESFYDGVGDWSGWGTRVAPTVAPGDSFVVRLTAPRAGTFIYHTHVSEGIALASGLYGALIVLPKDKSAEVPDHIVLVSIGGPHDEARPLINGSTAPPPIELKRGVPHRFRFINISPLETHTIQLTTGDSILEWRALAKDGADLPRQQATSRASSIAVHPGETYDFEVTRTTPEPVTLKITSPPTMASREDARARRIPLPTLPRIITRITVIVR